jgi:hypothetical protein
MSIAEGTAKRAEDAERQTESASNRAQQRITLVLLRWREAADDGTTDNGLRATGSRITDDEESRAEKTKAAVTPTERIPAFFRAKTYP